MLRITIHDNPGSFTFRLEGKLVGPWVRELEECWQCTIAGQPKPVLRVDLTGVTAIDATAKKLLAAMHGQGAEFVTADCLTKAVVAEITKAPIPDCGSPKREAAEGDPGSAIVVKQASPFSGE